MNKELIARLRDAAALPTGLYAEAADALEEAERTAQFNFEQYQDAARLLCEADGKLEIAIKALEQMSDALECFSSGNSVQVGVAVFPSRNIAQEALVKIGVKDDQ